MERPNAMRMGINSWGNVLGLLWITGGYTHYSVQLRKDGHGSVAWSYDALRKCPVAKDCESSESFGPQQKEGPLKWVHGLAKLEHSIGFRLPLLVLFRAVWR